MKVTQSMVTKLTITEAPNLDPITAILEDIGPNRGRIIIECYGQSWSGYWGGMSGRTLAQFMIDCDQHYIANALSSMPSTVFDPDGLIENLKSEIVKERRKLLIGREEARERFNRVDDLDLPTNENELWSLANEMQELVGEEWWLQLPQKTNPDYSYLCRIVTAVKDALLMLSGPALVAA